MKIIILLIVAMSLFNCGLMKNNQNENSTFLIQDLVTYIIQESFPDNTEVCLNEKSMSFEFKFPDSFIERDTTFSKEEIAIIEKEFNSAPINWKETLKTRYKSNRSPGCLFLSKPIFFRNNQLAFVYESRLGSAFYTLYEKHNSGWKLKETLISTME